MPLPPKLAPAVRCRLDIVPRNKKRACFTAASFRLVWPPMRRASAPGTDIEVRSKSRMVDTPTADSPAEPDITHVNPAGQKTWFGHPRQLARMFTTEMWERFGYLRHAGAAHALPDPAFHVRRSRGDRHLWRLHRAGLSDPLIGGYLADQYLGSKRAVKFGAIVMSLGYSRSCASAARPPSPHATIDGQRYEVSIEKIGRGQGSPLRRRRRRGSSRSRAMTTAASTCSTPAPSVRKVAQGNFESGADRSPLYVMVAADRAVDGLGGQRLLQAQHLDHGR